MNVFCYLSFLPRRQEMETLTNNHMQIIAENKRLTNVLTNLKNEKSAKEMDYGTSLQ